MGSKHSKGETGSTPSVRRSLVLSFAQRYTSLLIMVPTIMVVSRLLTPAQIGVYSVAVAFVTLAHMLRDFGVSDYLVQESDLDDAATRTAFTINLCIAWVLAVALFASSHWIAVFYQKPQLQLIVQIMCINFLLLPFGSTISSLLQRAMHFSALYKINVGQQLAQSGLTITLAAIGFGAASLAWGSVAGMVATTLGSLFWGRAYRVRGIGLSRWRAIAYFGVQRTLADVIGQLALHAPDFVIGRVLGFTQVGLYSRGRGLLNMFRKNILGAIQAVAFPALARDHRETNSAHILFLKTLTYVTGIVWPFFAFSGLMAFPIMRIMFGSQWDAAVPVLQILAIAGSVGISLFGFAQLLVVIGRVGLVTFAAVVIQTVRIASIIVAAFYGLYAVAASQILVNILAISFHGWLLFRYARITPGDVWNALRPSLAVALAAMLGPILVYVLIPPSDERVWMPLILAGASACLGWLLGAIMAKHPLWSEIQNVIRLYRRRASAQI